MRKIGALLMRVTVWGAALFAQGRRTLNAHGTHYRRRVKMRKVFTISVLAMVVAGAVFGQNTADFQTQVVESGTAKTITIIGYTGTEKNLEIPDKIDGISVIAIGKEAFKSKGLTSVVIAEGVKTIGDMAFAYNPLGNIRLPNSITSIGPRGFYYQVIENLTNMTGLRATEKTRVSLTIGSNVDLAIDAFNLDFYALYDKTGRAGGTYTLNSGKWTDAAGQKSGDFLLGFNWEGSRQITVWGYMGMAKDIVIPEQIANIPVTVINTNEFDQPGLLSITVPQSVTTIRDKIRDTGKRGTITGFVELYNQSGKKAGKYSRSGNSWSFTESN
jgi:hypothetical protein